MKESGLVNVKRGTFGGVIVEHEACGHEHRTLTVGFSGQAGQVFAAAQPGQFISVLCREGDCATTHALPLLRRPFSISAVGHEKDVTYLTFIYRIIGVGTRWLARRRVGEIVEMLGPLGRGFKLNTLTADKPCILIGGGVGLPPMFFLADALKAQGMRHVQAIAGARSADQLACHLCDKEQRDTEALTAGFVIEQLKRSETPAIITTDDGSLGYHGTVLAALEKMLHQQEGLGEAHLFACGPEGMLKALARFALDRNMPCQVCLESYMACGIGVCQSCVVKTHSKRKDGTGEDGYKLVCSHGPVFDAQDINWE